MIYAPKDGSGDSTPANQHETEHACVIPDMWHGVRMHHSGDMVTVYHGTETPIRACGFHVRYYMPEVYRAAQERAS